MGIALMIDATITIGNIIEISVLVVGGIAALMTIRNTVVNMKADLTDMKVDIKKFGEALVELAVTGQRLTNVEQDIRDLRRGHGFIVPRSEGGVNGEYP